jgi:hypothetical protein
MPRRGASTAEEKEAVESPGDVTVFPLIEGDERDNEHREPRREHG